MIRCASGWPSRRAEAGQRGIATVEFAVGMVVILLLMLVAAEIGRAYYSYNTLTKSVRSGARYLSTVALNNANAVDLSGDKVTKTKSLVISGDLDGGGTPVLSGLGTDDITLSELTPTGAFSPYVQVSASYDYEPIFGAIPGFGVGDGFDFGFTMQVASTMRVQR